MIQHNDTCISKGILLQEQDVYYNSNLAFLQLNTKKKTTSRALILLFLMSKIPVPGTGIFDAKNNKIGARDVVFFPYLLVEHVYTHVESSNTVGLEVPAALSACISGS